MVVKNALYAKERELILASLIFWFSDHVSFMPVVSDVGKIYTPLITLPGKRRSTENEIFHMELLLTSFPPLAACLCVRLLGWIAIFCTNGL